MTALKPQFNDITMMQQLHQCDLCVQWQQDDKVLQMWFKTIWQIIDFFKNIIAMQNLQAFQKHIKLENIQKNIFDNYDK